MVLVFYKWMYYLLPIPIPYPYLMTPSGLKHEFSQPSNHSFAKSGRQRRGGGRKRERREEMGGWVRELDPIYSIAVYLLQYGHVPQVVPFSK